MIYVDTIVQYPEAILSAKAKRYGARWCHMWSDQLDAAELHAFAKSLGLARSYFQATFGFPHYDLVPSKRALAIEKGATEMTLREWIRQRKSTFGL